MKPSFQGGTVSSQYKRSLKGHKTLDTLKKALNRKQRLPFHGDIKNNMLLNK